MGSTIIGAGKALPSLVVTNDDMARVVDTSDAWIVQRTGIRSRRVALGETTTDLASAACLAALGRAGASPLVSASWTAPDSIPDGAQGGIDPASIDLLVCMTISADAIVPSQAALVKARLGLDNAIAFDLNAACSGCVYGLSVADSMMVASCSAPGTRNRVRRALVVGVDRLSRITDWTDRATCVLFGDGAGAVLLEWRENARGIRASYLANVDDAKNSLWVAASYDDDAFPFPLEAASAHSACEGAGGKARRRGPFIRMDGRAVFKFATSAIVHAVTTVCARADVDEKDLALIVPHQANERIIRYAAKKLGVPTDLFQISISESANTSAASVLMALADAYASGRILRNDEVVLVGFGGGLTSGAVLFEA